MAAGCLVLLCEAASLLRCEARAAAVAGAGAPGASPSAAGAAAEWPQWRGPARDGIVKGIPEKLPEKAEPVWQVALTGPAHGGVLVADGLVVCVDSIEDARKDVIRAFKAGSGEVAWRLEYTNEGEDDEEMDWGSVIRATPVIHDGRVFTLAARGDVHAVDLKTGKVAWKKNLVTDFKGYLPTWGYCSSPLMAGGNLILNPGSRAAAVVALDPKDGKLVWAATGSSANYSSFVTATIGGTEQLIGYDQAVLFGRSLKDGAKRWSIPVETSAGYLVPSPVFGGGRLVLTREDGTSLHAFAEDGTLNKSPVGESEAFLMENNTPVVLGDIVLGTSNGEGLLALDLKDGLKELWRLENEPGFTGFSTILAGDGRALVFDDRGTLHLVAVDRKAGKVLGKLKLCRSTLAAPALAGTHFFVRDPKNLYCYNLAPGK
jgi:outer membrane protein assembly factor BamB